MTMKSLLVAVLVLSSVSPALASMIEARAQRTMFKAVADAVIHEHKIRENESIHAIINDGRDSYGAYSFTIQYLSSEGTCLQEKVSVYAVPGSDGHRATASVVFYRRPRQVCQ